MEKRPIVSITPALAEKWLKTNAKNRNVRNNVVEEYAKAMKDGRWLLNGETIKFDEDGNLLDGQHRLMAIVQSGETIQSYIIGDLDAEVYKTIDIGSKRTVGDALDYNGYKNGRLTAAIVSLVVSYRNKRLISQSRGGSHMQPQEILDFVAGNPQVITSAAACLGMQKLLPPSVAGAIHFLFAEKDIVEADKFIRDLRHGANLGMTDPVYALRNKLAGLKSSKMQAPKDEIFIWCCNAWNARREKRTLRVIRGSIRDENGVPFYPQVL